VQTRCCRDGLTNISFLSFSITPHDRLSAQFAKTLNVCHDVMMM
jgi:hypothetical protein